MMIGNKELKIRTNEQRLSMMIQRNKKVRPPMKTNYTLTIYGVVQKPRPFQSFVSIIYANMKDKNILFLEALLRCYHCHTERQCLSMLWLFPGVGTGQGEKVVVSGCGLCSPGVRLALWGAGSTRPAAHSLHSHITWLWWRWQYGENDDLMLAIATVGGYLALSSAVVWMSAWRPFYVRLKPNEERRYIREGSTKW